MLRIPQRPEPRVPRQQRPRRAKLHYRPPLQNRDRIRVSDRVQPVRDRDDRVAGELLPQQRQHQRLRRGVDAAGGLVQDEQTAGVMLAQDGGREAQELLLASGQGDGGHGGIEAAAGVEEGPEADSSQSGDQGVWGQEGVGVQVGADGAGVEVWFLRDGDDAGADEGEGEVGEGDVVDGDGPGGEVEHGEDGEEDG